MRTFLVLNGGVHRNKSLEDRTGRNRLKSRKVQFLGRYCPAHRTELSRMNSSPNWKGQFTEQSCPAHRQGCMIHASTQSWTDWFGGCGVAVQCV